MTGKTAALVSVLIPTYNRAYIIERAIESALTQGHEPIEVLVIDDGSQDGTREFIRERYGNDPRVRYFYKENAGVASARNVGIRESRGEFVAFLDSDDEWLPGKIALQLEGLGLAPEAGMIWTDMRAVGPDRQILHSPYLRKMYQTYRFFATPQDIFSKELALQTKSEPDCNSGIKLYVGEIFSPMALGNLVHTSTALFRRERLLKVGYFREDYRVAEDYEFYLRTCKEGPVAFLDAVTVSYQIGMKDALTSPAYSVPIVTNYVEILERTLSENRDLIRLPQALIRECRASAYAWAGQSCLTDGQNERARRYFLKSLKINPLQPQLFKYLGAALLSPKALAYLRNLRK